MLKPFTGSWFDMRHPNTHEAVYWNPKTRCFTPDQWRSLVGDMAAMGLEHLVLLSIAHLGQTFYPSKSLPRYPMATADPLEVVFSEADRLNLSIYVGAGFFGAFNSSRWEDPQDRSDRETAMNEVAQAYGHHPSFAGWYLPLEAAIHGHFPPGFIRYTQGMAKTARRLLPQGKILIAPYGTRSVIADDQYRRDLDSLDVDIIAYQDEVGVEKTQLDELEGIFSRLHQVHQGTRVALWADIEIFRFESKVYGSPLLAAPVERIQKQLEIISPWVERVLCYQYPGILSRPGSPAALGSSRAEEGYLEFQRLTRGGSK